ncbi:MAG: tetratricopeptide repeat protein, partial [Bacteroidetes bacterium]|nr:tetratricopeptide repeat protein [Bacteroidota bacterium]
MKKLFILATFLFIDYYTGIAQFQSINFSELEKKAISLCKERKYEAALSLYLSLEDQIKISSKRHQLAFHISRHNVIKYILLRKKTSDLDKYVLESIEKIEEINGKSDTILIDFYRTLGLSSFNLTKYQEAENSFDHALKIYSNNPQYEGHYSIASLFDITIKNLISKGDIYNALIYCKKALAFAKEHFDETDSTFGKIFERFGHCYRKLNSIEESKFYYEKALVVYRNFYGDNNLNISNIYDRIGRLHIASDDYQEAIQYLQKGLRIRKNILEPTDFKIGASFDNIGNSYYYLKEYQKAIIFFRKALGAFRYSASKTTHADQYSKIAACYTNLNDFQKAEHYLDSCFRILEFDRDIDHPF